MCATVLWHDLDYAPTKSGTAWINKQLLRKEKKKYHVCLNLSMPLTFNLGHTHNNKKKNKRHVPVRLKKRNQAMLETGGKKGKKNSTCYVQKRINYFPWKQTQVIKSIIHELKRKKKKKRKKTSNFLQERI